MTVEVSDGLGVDTETITVSILDAVSEVGPKITAVRVNGTSWTQNFRDKADGQVVGSGLGQGYLVSNGANQLQSLPWTGVNQVVLTFNGDVRGPGGAALTASASSWLALAQRMFRPPTQSVPLATASRQGLERSN